MQHTARPLQDALNKSVPDFSVPLSNSVWERSFARDDRPAWPGTQRFSRLRAADEAITSGGGPKLGQT